MAPEEEELVDYEDEIQDEVPALAPTTEGANGKAASGEGEKKGSYVGIHSTGFRYVFLL